MSVLKKSAFAASMIFAAACQPDPDAPTAPEAAASEPAVEAASLPIAHILLGKVVSDGEGVSIVEIEPLLAAPAYQNQPTFAAPDENRFYYVAGNENGKTDLWSFDLSSGEKTRITDTPEKSEFSPKPAPDGGVSFIQESEDGEMTRVHALREIGDPGAAVIETGPVGYYEWLQGGATLSVFYRSEPPMLQLVDVATGEARDVFDNVGRVLLSSPDGATLFAARGDEAGQYEIVAVDIASGVTEPVLDLPPGAQDFFLTFGEEGLPAMAYSSMGSQLMTYDFASDSIWHGAADIGDLGYGSITRVSVAGAADSDGSLPILFVAHPKDE
ncbi:TolB family protein [Hyphococcus sp.]|jgi:hypothetical protein|uniref:TolB family protein n=1 Tax=Hyphococcus sp. TaxID=2038636 RepID=UPI003D0F41D6